MLKINLLVLSIASILFIGCDSEEDEDSYELAIFDISDGDFVFTHLSDIHGYDVSMDVALELNKKSNVDFALMTGDNLLSAHLVNKLKTSKKPFLIIPGNHDTYDYTTEYDFRKNVLDVLPNDSIQFADDIHNYWVYDFHKNGRSLRVVGLDQYQIQTMDFDTVSAHYDIMMSQEQVDWFISKLRESSDFDGVLVAIHVGLGNRYINARDTTYVNDFVSVYAKQFKGSYDYNGSGDPRLLADIINAYQTGSNIKGVEYESGSKGNPISVTTNFKKASSNFIGLFGGHLHWDEVEKLPNYDFLQCLVAWGGYGKGCSYDDLVRNTNATNSYVINVNSIDFENKTLKIQRIGANVNDDGITRDSISYNWKYNEFLTE